MFPLDSPRGRAAWQAESAPAPDHAVESRRSRRAAGRRRRLQDFNHNLNPPISVVQWSWVTTTLAQSTADWLIVVGNDPVWSVGQHGPTWALVDKLLPLMDAAGVALYISGRDPIAQHIAPSTTFPNVDFAGVGIGSAVNASQAAAPQPSLALVPQGSLAWVYGGGTGFLTASVGNSSGEDSTLTVDFYGAAGSVLYSFTKGNPRRAEGLGGSSTGAFIGSPGSGGAGGKALLADKSAASLAGPVALGVVVLGCFAAVCCHLFGGGGGGDDEEGGGEVRAWRGLRHLRHPPLPSSKSLAMSRQRPAECSRPGSARSAMAARAAAPPMLKGACR